MSVSLSQYVLKVSSRCDLACDHCYVYESADQSWRAKPKAIAAATVRQAARRIGEHAGQHGLGRSISSCTAVSRYCWGTMGCSRSFTVLRSVIDPVTGLDLRVHTNGVLLDERLC